MKKLVEGLQAKVQQETQPCQKTNPLLPHLAFLSRACEPLRTFWHVKIDVIGSWVARGSTACRLNTKCKRNDHSSPFNN